MPSDSQKRRLSLIVICVKGCWKELKLITMIWVIFALLFFGLAYFHYHASKQVMPHFVAKPTSGVGAINGTPLAKSGFRRFITELNSYIDKQNEYSRNQNIMALIGYLFACFIAILSAALTVDRCSEWFSSVRMSCFALRSQREAPDNKELKATDKSAS